ncbi:MAG: aldo/keto reductase [Spirochaetaceae bacterium]|nr:MAG: aldo/keto reductase [Spirochaetaceae bacterium]
MKFRRLGKSGLEVSVIGVGTYQFGGEWGKDFSQREADAILDAAAECGINLIDTAECYGDHLAEQLIGDYLRHDRSRWIVATKFGHRFHRFQERTRQWRPEEVRRQIEESLRALHTDYIDILQYHSPSNEELLTPGLKDLLELEVRAGKVRHIGISLKAKLCRSSDTAQVQRAPELDVQAMQILYNRLERGAEENIFPLCRELDLGVIARVPLASGLLTGKYAFDSRFPDNDVRAHRQHSEVEEMLREVEEIRRNELPDGWFLSSWALAWCLKHPAVSCVIPGCKSVQQVLQNARTVDLLEETHPQDIPYNCD